MPRAIEHLIHKLKSRKEASFKLYCSYYEIYNEKVMDLLDPSSESLRVGEDKQRGFYVENLI
jgi:hypothetical protein